MQLRASLKAFAVSPDSVGVVTDGAGEAAYVASDWSVHARVGHDPWRRVDVPATAGCVVTSAGFGVAALFNCGGNWLRHLATGRRQALPAVLAPDAMVGRFWLVATDSGACGPGAYGSQYFNWHTGRLLTSCDDRARDIDTPGLRLGAVVRTSTVISGSGRRVGFRGRGGHVRWIATADPFVYAYAPEGMAVVWADQHGVHRYDPATGRLILYRAPVVPRSVLYTTGMSVSATSTSVFEMIPRSPGHGSSPLFKIFAS